MTEGKITVTNSMTYPRSDQWASSALKTVYSHYGHSCGWFGHELLIWLQVNLLGITLQAYMQLGGGSFLV